MKMMQEEGFPSRSRLRRQPSDNVYNDYASSTFSGRYETLEHPIRRRPSTATESIFDGTQLNVSNAYVHPEWNVTETGGLTTRLVNDIAIVELLEPLVFNEKIQPICLLGDFAEVEGQEAHIAGYGGHEDIDANGTTSIEYDSLLRATAVEFQPFENCHRANLDENNGLADINVHPQDVVCVGAKGRGPWQGDSGGPLMVAQDGVWFEVGLFSWGTGKRIMEQDAYSASYTRIASYSPKSPKAK